MNPFIILWAILATIILTTAEGAARGLGWSRMNMPFLVGSAFTANRDRAETIGFAVHFLNGVLFALVYALVFEGLGWATAWLGVLMGLLHAAFVLAALMPVLPAMHPRMADETQGPTPTRMLQPAGFMALNYGRPTAIVTIVGHALYGMLLGALYSPVPG
ncbi:MAG: hypothetical protein WD749_01265 [Phycisphaerales bacterium]